MAHRFRLIKHRFSAAAFGLLRRDRIAARLHDDEGMTTAEYAVGTVAACAFAAVLLKVVSGHEVLALLTAIVTRALHTV
jgi:multisubunit Na+/H+ antiporter MnhG subunit